MRSFFGSFFAVFLLASTAAAQEAGGAGESCRARSDCKSGLKCVAQVCVDEHDGQACGATADCGGELKCIKQKCTTGKSASASTAPTESAPPGEWSAFQLGGVHPFVGLVWAGALVSGGTTGNRSQWTGVVDGGFLFAVRGGVFIGKHELALEVSPLTDFWDLKATGPVFQANATYGYFIPVYEGPSVQLYWPLRVGVGTSFGPDQNELGLAYFLARADLVGMSLKIGHLMLDFMVPSFRYRASDRRGTQAHFLSWELGMGASYIF